MNVAAAVTHSDENTDDDDDDDDDKDIDGDSKSYYRNLKTDISEVYIERIKLSSLIH
jgi:hypothetical protein